METTEVRISKENVDDVFEAFLKRFERSFHDARFTKVELILVLLGEKSATDILIPSIQGQAPEARERDIMTFIRDLEYLGLSVVRPKGIINHLQGDYGYDVVYVSIDSNKAQRLSELMFPDSNEQEAQRAEELGALLGFPPSASRAYSEAMRIGKIVDPAGPLLLVDETPKEIQGASWLPFLGFRLSREHWKEEINTVKRWAETIRQSDPELYQYIIASEKANV